MTTYYSIYIPNKLDSYEYDKSSYVFNDMDEALKVLRIHKDGRLKIFKKYEEAESYSQTGYEIIPKYADLKSPSAAAENAAFRAPTKQQLIKFRKTIEEGNLEKVKETIWENPRYLVNSGDTPTSLKDGYRYNALHICAINKKADIAELILQTISKISFIELLHGNKNSKTTQEVSDILLEYYLNMPEKGRSETPLHIAVKYGAVEVVEVLTTYPQCKMTANLENMLPKDIICDRMYSAPFDLKEKIAKLLQERFYVPVIRSVDHSIPPIIGEPFSPKNPPELNTDPLSPEVEIQALAGPMSRDQAQNFRKRWKTPPRISASSPTNNSNNPFKTPIKYQSSTPTKPSSLNGLRKLLFSEKDASDDCQNGNNAHNECSTTAEIPLEVSAEDAVNNNGHIIEPVAVEFLKPKLLSHLTLLTPLRKNPKKHDLFFAYRDNPSTPIGLNDSSSSMDSTRDFIDSPALKELNVKLTDPEKGLEMLGRELAKEHQIEWKEYWDFLGCFIDITSDLGLQRLEEFFDNRQKHEQEQKLMCSKKNKEEQLMNNLCNALDQLELYREHEVKCLPDIKSQNNKFDNELNSKPIQNPSSPSATPYLCIEKSLQVFAKRLTKTFLINAEKITTMNDSFLSELKKLKSLICSFKCDSRFLDVNFTFVHSRFANLISNFLKTSQEIDNNKLHKIQQNFKTILESRIKTMDNKNIWISPNSIDSLDKKEQLQCVTELILKFLNDAELKIQPENLKTESICLQTWLHEIPCSCSWDTKILQKSYRKKRQELSDVSRRLFDSSLDTGTKKPIIEIETNVPVQNLWNYRNNSTSDDNSDDDVFLSDYGSENEDDDNELFFTPPDSPFMLTVDEYDLENYDNYVLGNEPTKRDLDLLNAVFHIDIHKDKFPNIYRWKAAILKHPNDERDGFPSPSVVVKTKNDFKRKDILYSKQISMSSPMRATYIPSSLSNICTNEHLLHLRLSSTTESITGTTSTGYSSTSPASGSTNISFLNVSEV